MPELTVRPLTTDRWADLEALFAARGCGAARRCWCIYYRRTGRAWDPSGGRVRADANRAALKVLAGSGQPPGLIAYRGKAPVGWVSLGPREEFARLQRSSVMKPVDHAPEVARRRPHRPVVRRSIAASKRSASRRAAPRGAKK